VGSTGENPCETARVVISREAGSDALQEVAREHCIVAMPLQHGIAVWQLCLMLCILPGLWS
jgi:hypothetical protein